MTDIEIYNTIFDTKLSQEYMRKNEMLTEEFGKDLEAHDFYSQLFNDGIDLQKRNGTADGKANIIVVSKTKDNVQHRYTIHPDNNFEDLDFIPDNEFAFTSPISYFGKNRTLKNARFMYAMTVDLDDVGEEQLANIIYRIGNGTDPAPTYIANSGTGLHLYYKFEVPIPMYPKMQEALKVLKRELTQKVWNLYTSRAYKKIQFQSINQGFRIVGGKTKTLIFFKDGREPEVQARGIVKVWKTGDNITLDYLTSFIKWKEIDFNDVGKYGKSKYSLNEAKEKFPEWYEKRIIENKEAGQWYVKKDLYNWWIEKVKAGAVEGHRYWCIYCLSAYAVKCGVDKNTLKKDAMELQPYLNEKGTQPFTRKDVNDALKLYKDTALASKFTRKYIEEQTAIEIPANKRNGRKQELHLKMARAIRDISQEEKGTKWNGRKPKKDIVQDWKKKHPDGKPKDCIKDTGLNKNTVYKWWDD